MRHRQTVKKLIKMIFNYVLKQRMFSKNKKTVNKFLKCSFNDRQLVFAKHSKFHFFLLLLVLNC